MAGEPGQQHDELLAPEAAHQVVVAQLLLQHPGHGGQHLVAVEVAVRVVDLLEVVEIEDQQGGLAPFLLGDLQRL
ncbi:hypothetical protein FRP1_15095 [Pseudonocardia sp. EC080625-04]|nr:hypothetical protein [Pseudonocardia sp. EC080625-04]ALE74015.1 hypothetical protein FRP1_15095 [Pseudonocardia sp. EC080625-04]